MQTTQSVEERLATLEQAIIDLGHYVRDDTKTNIEKLDRYLRENNDRCDQEIKELEKCINRSNTQSDKNFKWLIGIFIATFSSIILLIVKFCA